MEAGGCFRSTLAPSAPSALLPHRGTKGAHLLPPMGADDHAKHGPVGGCGLSDFHPFQKPQASACEPPFLMGVRATRPQHNQRLIPPSDGAIQNRRILRKTTLTMLPPRREEGAHGQRPFAAAGGGRAGTGSRGLLGRSGDLMLVRPARRRRGRGKGFVPLRSPGAAGHGSARVPVRPEQGHLPGTLADNGCAERRASSKRYLSINSGRMSGAPRPFPDLQRVIA